VRWEFVPVLFALAGAVGGALDALLSQVVMGKYGSEAAWCAYIGGGIGLGIGCAMCLSRRFWVRVGSAPFLGVAGYFAAMCLMCLVDREKDIPGLNRLAEDVFARYLAAPAAPILVLAHHLHLRLRDRGVSPVVSMPLYGLLGAVSGSIFWFIWEPFFPGLLNGALYGLCQHVAMMAALGLERWRSEPEAAQGFSPRQ
jgi:hypothetical protein